MAKRNPTEKQKQAKAQKESIGALLAMVKEPKEVEVRGHVLRPQKPSRKAKLLYKKIGIESFMKNNSGEFTSEQLVEMTYDAAVVAIMGCFPDIDREEAEDLIAISGGERGELVEACLDFYGVDKRAEEAYKRGELDLSFLSPGPQAEA